MAAAVPAPDPGAADPGAASTPASAPGPPPAATDLPPTPGSGLTEAEAARRRAAGLGNTAPPATTPHVPPDPARERLHVHQQRDLRAGRALVLVGRPMDALVSLGVIAHQHRRQRGPGGARQAHPGPDRPAHATHGHRRARRARERGPARGPRRRRPAQRRRRRPGGARRAASSTARWQADESQLTGESDLIRKHPGDEVFSGSFVVTGGGATSSRGRQRQPGEPGSPPGARTFRRVLTPLQSEINLVIRVVLLIVRLPGDRAGPQQRAQARARPARPSARPTLLVGLVPNGLFVSIAIAYALGAVRIVRYGALVQQSNAVESLSNVDVLCLDKTGTLTANRLVVEQVVRLAGSRGGSARDPGRRRRQRRRPQQDDRGDRRRVPFGACGRSPPTSRSRRPASGAPSPSQPGRTAPGPRATGPGRGAWSPWAPPSTSGRRSPGWTTTKAAAPAGRPFASGSTSMPRGACASWWSPATPTRPRSAARVTPRSSQSGCRRSAWSSCATSFGQDAASTLARFIAAGVIAQDHLR